MALAPPADWRADCSPSAPDSFPGSTSSPSTSTSTSGSHAADVVVTGEGFLDAQSLDGKVVGGVCALAAEHDLPVVVIVGDADPEAIALLDIAQSGVTVVSLVDRFGEQRAFNEPRWCIEQAVGDALRERPHRA